LTAKIPGASAACTTIPLCGRNPAVDAIGAAVQMTHRAIAVLLFLHLIGVVAMLRRRRAEEAPIVLRTATIALGMVVLQLVLASTMILLTLPAVLRSLHEATGIAIWLSCFLLAYLARRTAPAADGEPVDAAPRFGGRMPPVPATEQ
jgi:heme A synthase